MQSITIQNYFEIVPGLEKSHWPAEFRELDTLMLAATKLGTDLNSYRSNETIASTLDLYLDKLNEYLSQNPRTEKLEVKKSPRKQASKRKAPRKTPVKPDFGYVRDTSPEQRLLSRFVNLHDRDKTYDQVLRVFQAINRAAEKGQVRKTQNPTPHWKEVEYAQKVLHAALGRMDPDDHAPMRMKFNAKKIEELRLIARGSKVWPGVRLALRFIGMQGKAPDAAKVERLLKAVEKASKTSLKDPAGKHYKDIIRSLKSYLDDESERVQASPQALNGLQASLQGCGCKVPALAGLAGREYLIPPPTVQGELSPISFRSDRPPLISEESLPFSGAWKELFNEPPRGFSALIYGKPKNGKSTLAADLGGYLARSFGRVLYASIEEGGRASFLERLDRLQAGHPNMEVKNYLPADLSPYDFVITDSVSRGNLDIHAIRRLISDWPGKSFFFIFHTTKEGLPRGTNEFLHEVDVLVEVKNGVARADGRFGPGEREVRFGPRPVEIHQ